MNQFHLQPGYQQASYYDHRLVLVKQVPHWVVGVEEQAVHLVVVGEVEVAVLLMVAEEVEVVVVVAVLLMVAGEVEEVVGVLLLMVAEEVVA